MTQTSYSTITNQTPALLALVLNLTALPRLPGVVVLDFAQNSGSQSTVGFYIIVLLYKYKHNGC